MFLIDGGGELRRIRRRPHNWERLEAKEDCRFLPENRPRDVDDRERIAQAIELYDVMPSDSIATPPMNGGSSGEHGNIAWTAS